MDFNAIQNQRNMVVIKMVKNRKNYYNEYILPMSKMKSKYLSDRRKKILEMQPENVMKMVGFYEEKP